MFAIVDERRMLWLLAIAQDTVAAVVEKEAKVVRKQGRRKIRKYVTLVRPFFAALCDSPSPIAACERASKKGGLPWVVPPPNQPKRISAKIETGSSEFFS